MSETEFVGKQPNPRPDDTDSSTDAKSEIDNTKSELDHTKSYELEPQASDAVKSNCDTILINGETSHEDMASYSLRSERRLSARSWTLGSLDGVEKQEKTPTTEGKRPSDEDITRGSSAASVRVSNVSQSSDCSFIRQRRRSSGRSSITTDGEVHYKSDPLSRFHAMMADWGDSISDHGVLTGGVILVAIWIATICGTSAFCLHLAVEWAGCLGGLNGCKEAYLYDLVKPYLPKSLFFVITSVISGFTCSVIIYSPFRNRIGLKCRGGGSAGTKIIVGAGKSVSCLVPALRILLAALYLGGGNTLGTEGPIIHLASSLATWLVNSLGIKSRKMISMFAVVGAAAGMSAGFNVILTGFIFTIEELTRSLSQRSALVITLAAGVATLVRQHLGLLSDYYFHMDHASLVPYHVDWETQLTSLDISYCYALAIPIGIINGVAGWIFARCAWSIQSFFNPHMVGHTPTWFQKRFLPVHAHLAIVGFISACLGAVVYEVTGVNAVWGTTVGAIPETLKADADWPMVLLMFMGKFVAMTFATAVGGPGGCLVPSLAAGGLIGIFVGQVAGCNEQSLAACAVIGMGSLFASVMHLPITGVIMMFELTWAKDLIVHVIIGNFIASNVVHRLPLGHHSFVHRTLEHDPLWLKLGGQDFIENDEQARIAFYNEGIGTIIQFKTFAVKWWLLTDLEKERVVFQAWWKEAERNLGRRRCREELRVFTSSHRKYLRTLIAVRMQDNLRFLFGVWVADYIHGLKYRGKGQLRPFI